MRLHGNKDSTVELRATFVAIQSQIIITTLASDRSPKVYSNGPGPFPSTSGRTTSRNYMQVQRDASGLRLVGATALSPPALRSESDLIAEDLNAERERESGVWTPSYTPRRVGCSAPPTLNAAYRLVTYMETPM